MKILPYLLLILTIILISGVIHLATAIDSNDLAGVWKEKDGTAVYSFQKEHEFEYQVTYSSGRTTQELGVWQSGLDICWVRESKGNLTIHYGQAWCCHQANFLGKNLVLRAIPSRSSGVCANRVLIKFPGTEGKKQTKPHTKDNR